MGKVGSTIDRNRIPCRVVAVNGKFGRITYQLRCNAGVLEENVSPGLLTKAPASVAADLTFDGVETEGVRTVTVKAARQAQAVGGIYCLCRGQCSNRCPCKQQGALCSRSCGCKTCKGGKITQEGWGRAGRALGEVGPAALHKHTAQAATQLQQPAWGTDRPTPQLVGRWRARVEATAAELANCEFYLGLLRVLGQATLLASQLAEDSSSSSSSLTEEAAAQATAPGAAGACAPLQCRQLLPAVRCLVVYGLGSLEQPGGAHIRCQAALALRLARLLPALPARPEAYDPVFTGVDQEVLPALGFEVLARDEGGARVAAAPTLFYLPHCEDSLTDALLAANVVAGTLHQCAILGNRLSIYPERWDPPAGGGGGGGKPRSPRWQAQRRRPDTLLRLCATGVVVEQPIDECDYPVVSAFNDLALHTFVPDWRRRLARAEAA
eukprot:scaffold7.g3450.t1